MYKRQGFQRLLIAVLGTPAILVALALEPAGAVRSPPGSARISRRLALGLVAGCGIALVAPYTVTHQFVVDEERPPYGGLSESISGYSESESNLTVWASAKQHVPYGLSVVNHAMATTITSLRPLGDLHGLRIASETITEQPSATDPWPAAVKLPFHLARGKSLAVAYTFYLERCPTPVTVGSFRLGYKIAGISLSQTIAPEHSLTLACGPAPFDHPATRR